MDLELIFLFLEFNLGFSFKNMFQLNFEDMSKSVLLLLLMVLSYLFISNSFIFCYKILYSYNYVDFVDVLNAVSVLILVKIFFLMYLVVILLQDLCQFYFMVSSLFLF